MSLLGLALRALLALTRLRLSRLLCLLLSLLRLALRALLAFTRLRLGRLLCLSLRLLSKLPLSLR